MTKDYQKKYSNKEQTELPKIAATSDVLEEVVRQKTADTLTVDEIRFALNERGFGILLVVAAIPLCFPVPMPPGYTTIFSVPLFFLSIQMIVGMDSPWLPKWLLRKQIKRSKLAKLVEKSTPALRKIEKLMKPRLSSVSSRFGEKVVGIFAFAFTCSIAIPLPMTNVPPAFGILFMALGLLARDGLMIILGKIIGLIGIALTTAVILFGKEFIENMF